MSKTKTKPKAKPKATVKKREPVEYPVIRKIYVNERQLSEVRMADATYVLTDEELHSFLNSLNK